jgi:thioredoxin-like negative regulator of GroEL
VSRALRPRAAARVLATCMLAAVLVLPGCAKRVAPPVPQGEDYVFDAPVPGAVSSHEASELRAAWRDVIAGDAASAARRYEKLLKRQPGLAAARTGLAFARLRAGRLEEASAGFDAVLTDHPDDVPALVGAASAAIRGGDADAALAYYRRAQSVAPEDALVRKRLAAVRLQVTERRMGLAQAAVERGDVTTATREYTAALAAAPEVAGVRLTLADLLASGGDVPGALAVLEGDPSGDRQVALRRAAILMGQQEFGLAADVYRGLLARDPGDETARNGEKRARESLDMLSMPEEYRRIPDAPRITRADLAALVAVRVVALRRAGPGEPRVAVDLGGSWAREYIARVLALGIMEPYPNHTFQPGATVRRVDLARTAARTLDRLGFAQGVAPAPTDMSRSHLDYEAVERALAAGLMSLSAQGAFEPWRPVSGSEAIDVVEGVVRLVGP